MTPSDPRQEYLESRVSAATPVELTRMLYEGAVQSVQEAVAAHRAGDVIARGNAVTKAVEILGELRFSLRRDVAPQYCDTLSGLYSYLQNRVIRAHAEKSESMLLEVGKLIQTLLEGWIGAMQNLAAEDAPRCANMERDSEESHAFSASNPYSSRTPAEPRNRTWQF